LVGFRQGGGGAPPASARTTRTPTRARVTRSTARYCARTYVTYGFADVPAAIERISDLGEALTAIDMVSVLARRLT